MQDLWLEKTDWDEEIPVRLAQLWEEYRQNFASLSALRIPRWIQTVRDSVIEFHGFADASSRAYAAVVFIRVLHSPSEITTKMLVSKTKVAPLKTVSIPRLELNAIVLLVRLFEYVKQVFKIDGIPLHGWTDSTVALAWLSQHPSRWKPYVANRVSEIQTRAPEIRWHHVPTNDNPADCASRGISPHELKDHPLWWSGPPWLQQNSTFWPSADKRRGDEENHRTIIENEVRAAAKVHVAHSTEDWNLATKFSSWGKLLRVTAFILKFVRKLREPCVKEKCSDLVLTPAEIQAAREYWVKVVHSECFRAEIKALSDRAALPRTGSLKALNPFLDGKNQLRLGGRLSRSLLPYDERFPIILPRHHISDLIVDQAHLRTLHGGTQLTLRIIRQCYWILGARSLVKHRIDRCLICMREKAVTASQLMGDLPSPRVTPSPLFSHCGVDYAGPLSIIPYVGRGVKARKYYGAI